MSRRIPLCAYCGEKMTGKRSGHWRIKCNDKPGKPEFGWHGYESGDCSKKDWTAEEMSKNIDAERNGCWNG